MTKYLLIIDKDTHYWLDKMPPIRNGFYTFDTVSKAGKTAIHRVNENFVQEIIEQDIDIDKDAEIDKL